MKGWLGGLIIAGIGFGVGFFAGERFGRKEKEKDIQSVVVEETPTIVPGAAPSSKEVAKDICEKEGYISEERESVDKDLNEVNEYLSQFESPEEDSEDETEEDAGGVLIETLPEDYISLITADEFDADETYGRVSYTYYDEDDIVCDENEVRVEDAEDLIGTEALHSFGKDPRNPDNVVYVRNTWDETLYEITCIHNSYGRVVLGIDDSYGN